MGSVNLSPALLGTLDTPYGGTPGQAFKVNGNPGLLRKEEFGTTMGPLSFRFTIDGFLPRMNAELRGLV